MALIRLRLLMAMAAVRRWNRRSMNHWKWAAAGVVTLTFAGVLIVVFESPIGAPFIGYGVSMILVPSVLRFSLGGK